MPGSLTPSPNDKFVSKLLTDWSLAFPQREDAFVAHQVFPTIPVDQPQGKYATFPVDEWARDEFPDSAPATEAELADYKVDLTGSYDCKVKRLAKDIPDEERKAEDPVFNADRDATDLLTRRAFIRRDRYFAVNFMVGGVWTGGDVDGVAGAPGASQVRQWNDGASTPIEDIRAAKQSVLLKSFGTMPNTLTLGRQVYDKLLDHPDIVGRIDRGQTTGAAKANKAALAELFEVERILVMDGVYNSAVKNAAKSANFIGGKTALLSYAPPRPAERTPSAGYLFGWRGMFGADAVMGRTLKLRATLRSADRIQLEMAWDMKLIAADLGYFFDTVVA